ncbi:hypothetical protein [Lignipirellula cremea]|uniref:Glycosyltransferase RgtA/B/C/D-like domain-containing protein n=1 Tax=Lignipirellula cremea TaxID=2528010 RepID=A0A518DQ61_9BACT|nr:hypothetical protein [Lignipirellula cremea]QDU93968.1 hypothetical protein Pla8534_17540 [Lignipirellula cremea]
MPDTTVSPSCCWRWGVYGILIVASLGAAAGRILQVESRDGQAPFLSANDRSRWAAIRAMGDYGRYDIDLVIIQDSEAQRRWERFDHVWYSIDLVRHKGSDGKEHYYSSKPPLLAAMLTAPYWVLKLVTGETLATQPFYLVRTMLLLVNLPLMFVFLVSIAALAERYGKTDLGRILVVTAAAWGTLLTPFLVSLNNHLPAAASVAIASWAALAIWRGEKAWRYPILAGLFAAFAVANELPALAFAALLTGMIFYRMPARAALAFAPAAAAVAIAYFGVNWLAHDSWRMPYAHRSDGATLALIPGDWVDRLNQGDVPVEVREELESQDFSISPRAFLKPRLPLVKDGQEQQRWMLWDTVGQDRFALAAVEGGVEVRAWDNWYEYDGSYWSQPERSGVDRGEPSRLVYLFHMLLGHHGVFSLTPLWLLAVVGLFMALRQPDYGMRGAATATLALSVVCIAFYFLRPEIDRNYGGVSCGMRWLIWLIPLWLICLLPAADAASKTPARMIVALVLLGISCLSASYSAMNPWTHPWLFDYWTYLDWIRYP